MRHLDERHLLGDACQQADGVFEDLIEVVRALDQRGNGTSLGWRERLDVADLVDEMAVALLCGDPPGGSVRGNNKALFLKRSHVVADGSGPDAEVVPIQQGPRTHRLTGLDIVFNDGSEDLKPARFGHSYPPDYQIDTVDDASGCPGPRICGL